MFRKMTLVAIPAMALMLTLGTANSGSQAFAKGNMGKGGPRGMSRDHRGRDWRFDRFHRYGWDNCYGFGCVEPIAEVPVVTPACTTCEVAPVAVPTCTTCEAVVGGFPYWGYGRYGKFRDFGHHREHPLSGGHGGRGGRK